MILTFNNSWRKARRNFELGERLQHENTDPIYTERKNKLRSRLPAFKIAEDFCQLVFTNDVVILCGATGSGERCSNKPSNLIYVYI